MSDYFTELRADEFGRLDATGQAYLDYTGSGLYAESQVRAHTRFLETHLLGNPHSRNPTSAACTAVIEECRERVLRFFDADPDVYEVVFTPNATAALKLVGESFPFGPGSRCVLTADNHNSVHGLREFALARGADAPYVPLDAELRVPDLEPHLSGARPETPHLLVYPAQSNFSGVRHPAEWIDLARRHGYRVFLDAAAYVPTSRLSLREVTPDFVAVAFYKMCGFPTGVGALIARREALAELRRPWFGGGTVRYISVRGERWMPYASARGFEDGTPNFLGIAAVGEGLDFLDGVGVERIGAHVRDLTGVLLDRLEGLRHGSGTPLVARYGPGAGSDRGGTVAFNVLDPDGCVVDFREVERRATRSRISLRTGYFCNPGAAEYAFGHAPEELDRCLEGVTAGTFDIERFGACMEGKPVGAVRVSLGIASNEADIERLVEVLESFRDQEAPSFSPTPVPEETLTP